MSSSSRRRWMFWMTPAVAVLAGAAYLVGAAVGGQVGLGLALFAVMLVVAVVAVLSSRYSETVRGLLARDDERIVHIDLHATALTAAVMIVAILVGFVVELAHGRSGAPFSWLAAIGGLTYLGGAVFLRLRG